MNESPNPENTPLRKRGRPKGSKNKPKMVAPTSIPEAMAPFIPESIQKIALLQFSEAAPVLIRPVLTPEGFPNLPDGKIIGRPMGKKNSYPRKSRISPSQESEVIISDDVLVLPPNSSS